LIPEYREGGEKQQKGFGEKPVRDKRDWRNKFRGAGDGPCAGDNLLGKISR
jgi:hypothetical protein